MALVESGKLGHGYGALLQQEEVDEEEVIEEGQCGIAGKEQHLVVPIMQLSNFEDRVSELFYALLTQPHLDSHHHPRTSPHLPPVKRFQRHRNYYVYKLNEFRHWWKTSRLLVRLAGASVFCQATINWEYMGSLDVNRHKMAQKAAKLAKRIGQGGPIEPWLNVVQPFTRSIRLVLAIARALEARVDNRLYEVGFAEAFAFMGNRCSRHWARKLSDWMTYFVALPISGAIIAPFLNQNSRPIIILMGIIRAVLPFAVSFQGSRFGRQMTRKVYQDANYRWHPVQRISDFQELSGTYKDTNLDTELLSLARSIAEKIGHGSDPVSVRSHLAAAGFHVFGSGCGGYGVYRRVDKDKVFMLHLTPYGPSILNELPRFIILERRRRFFCDSLSRSSDATILDAAATVDAEVVGITYSGAYFQAQEWASLKRRYDRELDYYSKACSIMRTHALPDSKRNPQLTKFPTPPTDLVSLKAFLRTGRPEWKQRRDNNRWSGVQRSVKDMSRIMRQYQKEQKSPHRIVLYMEGLDCAGKSSTSTLICEALQQCGYSVTTARHNRPPTAAQLLKPWMNRSRFEYPDDMYRNEGKLPDYAAVVWDRGPVGDFVYGKLNELTLGDKLKRYQEFRDFDVQCHRDGMLFCKLFFVADRDSIASTLGKRLAHCKIAQDLRSWLNASSVEHSLEGIAEIERHIDPSDFVAFNNYEGNLQKFAQVVRNTDDQGKVGECIGYRNHWLVVNTSDRNAARVNILKEFRRHLQQYATCSMHQELLHDHEDDLVERQPLVAPTNDIVVRHQQGLSIRALFHSFLLLTLLYAYAYQTWNLDISDFYD